MKPYNVKNWTIGGAFLGLITSATGLNYTWDAADIGMLLGGIMFWGLIGCTIAIRQNQKLNRF